MDLQPNRGAFIAQHTLDTIRDSIEFIELLESSAGMMPLKGWSG